MLPLSRRRGKNANLRRKCVPPPITYNVFLCKIRACFLLETQLDLRMTSHAIATNESLEPRLWLQGWSTQVRIRAGHCPAKLP